MTLLLRSPSAFDGDATIQKYVKSGHARLVKGDATIEADVQRAWKEAGPVDAVIFSVGMYMDNQSRALITRFPGGLPPTFHLLKGFIQTPANLVTRCLLNVFCTMPQHSDAPLPKIIVITSLGVTSTAYKALPILLKPIYTILLPYPAKDKLGAERVIAHCAGWTWDPKADGVVAKEVLDEGWTQRKGLPAPGSLKRVLVIRPAVMTDGKSVGDELDAAKVKGQPYRLGEQELGGYTISRKDITHFLVDALTTRWNEFENKRVNIAY